MNTTFDDDDATTVAQGAEQEYVNRRVAEMDLHRQLHGTNVDERERRRNDDVVHAQILESLKLQYLQRRWECLYDVDEHRRLRNAIIDAISQNR